MKTGYLDCASDAPSDSGPQPADPGRVRTVRLLGLFFVAVALVAVVPALYHLNLATAPGWARVVLLVGFLQMAYVIWMIVWPDGSTVWVVMFVFAAVSALYASALAVGVSTPSDGPLPLGLGPHRLHLAPWSAAVLLLNALATYLAGRTATAWRRATR